VTKDLRYQRRAIQNYYARRDEIMVARISEIASDLALAETDAERTRLWKKARAALAKLDVPGARVDRVVGSRDPSELARLVEEIF
jgi:hypothetical protein